MYGIVETVVVLRDVEVRPTADRGLGVFVRRSFEPGERILRRRHEPVGSRADVEALPEDLRQHVCQVDMDAFALVHPPACYVNHACDPSAVRHGVDVVAFRRIEAGEEVTLDYRIHALDGDSWPCRCGTESCTGLVEGSFFAMPAHRQRLLLEHAPPFIRGEYRRRGAKMAR
jgi:hypothetical protein